MRSNENITNFWLPNTSIKKKEGDCCQSQGPTIYDLCPLMLNVNYSAKISPLPSTSTHSTRITTPTSHSDDFTFLTFGSSPASETVAEEVPLFVLAAHRFSGIARGRRALVWNIFKHEGEKEKKKGERSVLQKESVPTGCK